MLVAVPMVIIALPLTWLLLTRVLFRVREMELPLGKEMIATERASLGPMRRSEITVAAVSIFTALAWVAQPLIARVAPGITDANISIAGALLLLVIPVDSSGSRVIDWQAAERIPWGVLVLFGGGLSLAAAIQDSGLAAWIGGSVGALRGVPPIVLIAVVTTLVLFLTELTSNTATAAAFLPVVGSVAVGAGLSPLLLTVPAALAATCAFMLPVGTPPNAIVFGTGRLTIPLMARTGVLLNVMMIVIITLMSWLLVERVLGT
jgi:solute carrier family 13 (sodium-dependent dicarboxylate transporter), member 2/3/5